MVASLSLTVGRVTVLFYRYQPFALDSVTVKTKKILSSHSDFLTIAMYHHRLIKLTHYDDTKKKTHDSQIV